MRRLEGAPPPSIDLTSDDVPPADPVMDCPCGLGQCSVLTAKTPKNMGRQFFRCPVPERDSGCQFFKWCNEAQPANGASFASAPAQVPPGGFAGNQPYGGNAAAPNAAAEPAMACPCGLGQCSVLTAKTEKNMGKQVRISLACLVGGGANGMGCRSP